MQEQLSPHFKLSEFIVSGVALQQHIDNMPTDSAVVDRLRLLTEKVLEPLRLRFGVIRITSGYRCPRLNHAVGGRTVSQHLRGEAADIHISSMETGQKMFSYIEKNLISTSCSLSIPCATAVAGSTYPAAKWATAIRLYLIIMYKARASFIIRYKARVSLNFY